MHIFRELKSQLSLPQKLFNLCLEWEFVVQKDHEICITSQDAGRDWGQEKKGTTEDEMAGWHHGLDGRESE